MCVTAVWYKKNKKRFKRFKTHLGNTDSNTIDAVFTSIATMYPPLTSLLTPPIQSTTDAADTPSNERHVERTLQRIRASASLLKTSKGASGASTFASRSVSMPTNVQSKLSDMHPTTKIEEGPRPNMTHIRRETRGPPMSAQQLARQRILQAGARR